MISDLMAITNNYFEKFYINGDFNITDGKIKLNDKFVVGQYIRIIGSLLNDGVYKIEEKSGDIATLSFNLLSETFNGYIIGLAVPKSFETLSNEIDTWKKNNAGKKGLSSESSLNGYYSWSASAKDYQEAFADDIKQWQKPATGNLTDFIKRAKCVNE